MKRKIIISVCIALTALTALQCKKNENGNIFPQQKTMEFRASIETDDATKTILAGDEGETTRKIVWSPSDTIGIVSGTGIIPFIYEGNDTTSTASFSGTANESETYYALYPYSKTLTYADSKFSVQFPGTQEYKEGSFSNGLLAMVTKSTNQSLHFLNLMGALKLRLKGEGTVKNITFCGNDASGNPLPVSGNATIDMTYDSSPAVVMAATASTSVTLDCGEGVALSASEAKTFYIILPPATYTTSSVIITTTDGKMMVRSGTAPLIIKRSTGSRTPEITFTETPPIDLSASATANCYIAPAAGSYSINATVIGNGANGLLPDIAQSDKLFHTESVSISPLSAQILWQDVDGLVSGVRMSSDKSKVLFSTSASKGNALIAVYDNADPTADGAKILWSWHIWCTGAPSTHKYINRANREFTVLDRNLGATAADYGSGTDAEYLATYGLFYQWGRKDPFSRNDSHLSKEATSSSNGTIANTVSHPTIFYYNSSDPYDWFYGSSRNNYLWGNPYGYNYNSTVPYSSDGTASGTVVLPKKSVYDPCPPGYMVATKDMWTRFTTTGNNTNTSSEFNVDGSFSKGWRFYYAADKSGSTAWYPASGGRGYYDGSLYNVGSGGRYWGSSPNNSSSIDAGSLSFHSGYVGPLNGSYGRAYGFAVRCLQESVTLPISAPIVSSAEPTGVSSTSATCGGNVTDDGGADVTSRGVVWSTSQNPTVSLTTKTSDGTGKGEFTSSLTGLTPGTTYYVRAYATNSQGTAYGEQKTFTTLVNESDYSSLSTSGTANCYIVSTSGLYSFDATVIGNGANGLLPDIAQSDKLFHTESVSISPLSAQILWQDVDGLVSGVRMSSDKSKVLLSTSASKGNALIAVYDNADPTASGAKILWSWHIWCTAIPSTHNYINRANQEFTVLDRNLGATAADYGSGTDAEYLDTYGLFYQWGRKDPFPGSASASSGTEKTLYGNVTSVTKTATSSSNGTIANTVSHPTTYYYNSSDPYDWFYGSSRNNYLWGNPYGYNYNTTVPYSSDGTASGTVVLPKKSVYDPCPPGYMVATRDMWTRFTTTGYGTSTSSEFNVDGSFSKGWRFYYAADKSGSTAWYPASGCRYYDGGSLNGVGSYGGYWSSSPYDSSSIYAGYLGFGSGCVYPLINGGYRAFGFAVRCLQE